MERRAKIVATLGPASWEERTISRLLRRGVDVVRLNLSHGSREQHREALRRVRRLAASQGRHVPVVADLMGPRYRLGTIAGVGRLLRRGERVRLSESADADLPVDSPGLIRHLKSGERVLIDNGLVELEVESKRRGVVTARVVSGGAVATRKGINLPDSSIPFTISEKDREDIAFAVAEGADWIAASYVGSGADLAAVRRVIGEAGGALPIIAKLERATAVERLGEIIAAADAVMVARGDLGVEVPLYRVPLLQKEIVAAGRRLGKPVIVATQMLESMMDRPRPTRAEATDVANAVFDGADALMLSGETAAGSYPVEAVETMARIVVEAEAFARRQRADGSAAWVPAPAAGPRELRPGATELLDPARHLHFDIPDVVAAAAVFAAGQLGGCRIVAFSQGGFTARMIARYRPEAPILVFTTDPQVARRIQLTWGVRPLVLDVEVEHHDEVVDVVDRHLAASRLARPGETIVILMGDPIHERPLTNLMRVHRVRG